MDKGFVIATAPGASAGSAGGGAQVQPTEAALLTCGLYLRAADKVRAYSAIEMHLLGIIIRGRPERGDTTEGCFKQIGNREPGRPFAQVGKIEG